jgi:hypothetical protein
VELELGNVVLGFIVGGAFFLAVLRWLACLWATYLDYRVTVDYPHLKRPKRLWVFLPLLFLHSGPWALALAVFFCTRHMWFAVGFFVHLILTGISVALYFRKHPLRA